MNKRLALLTVASVAAFDTTPAPGGPYKPTPADVAASKAHYNKPTVERDTMLRRSADSASMVDYWELTDAIVDGIDAMVAAAEKFLPKFVDESASDYQFRLSCAKMTNIYRDTVEALSAKPFSKEVTLTPKEGAAVPEELAAFCNDVDGSGSNLTMFAAGTFFNGINSAIDWIFVDSPKADPAVRTRADQKAAGLRPYWSRVLGRNVLEAKPEIIGGKETLTYIRIFEPGDPDHVRVFKREPTGLVHWQLYVKTDNFNEATQTAFVLDDEGDVTGIDVIPLVPFYTGRRDGRTFRFFPAMRDAADLQRNLYKNESALEFAKVLAAYPMLAGEGVKAPKDAAGNVLRLAVGPGKVLYAQPDGNGHSGTWKYVEPAATSLTFLATDIKETQQQLRELGRQPLTAQSGNLTVITTAVAAGKAKSAVAAWALGLQTALEVALTITCKWLNVADYTPVASVFTDFDEFMEGKDLEDLNAMRKNGDLSRDTLWAEKKRRGVLHADFKPEDELKKLLDEVPTGDQGEDTTGDNEK